MCPTCKSKKNVRRTKKICRKKKRAVAQGVGGKPTNVKTFTKRTKAARGYAAGYMDQNQNKLWRSKII